MLIGKAATGKSDASSKYSTRADLSMRIEAALAGAFSAPGVGTTMASPAPKALPRLASRSHRGLQWNFSPSAS